MAGDKENTHGEKRGNQTVHPFFRRFTSVTMDLSNPVVLRGHHTKIPRSLDDAVKDAINTIATDYAKVPKLENSGWTVDKIENTLKKQLHQQKPAQMKLELVRKDLTWHMLNDGKVQQKIIELYPELEGTGLFQSRKAHAIP